MGIDFINCSCCNNIFSDGGDYDRCECGEFFCLRCRKDGRSLLHGYVDNNYDDEDPECVCCTEDYSIRHITKDEMLRFLLRNSKYDSIQELESEIRHKYE